MLHGGAGGARDLAPLHDLLHPGRRIIAPDQRAHGRSPDLGELTYAAMAGDTAALLDELGVCGADVVGWSDGGILALLLARDRPELVRRAVPISANVSSAPPPPAAMPQDALDWVRDHGDESITLPAGREELPGAPEAWPAVVRKLQAMWLDDPGISLTDLSALSTPVLYLAGDQDVVRAEHTLAMFQATPGAQLGIVPGATHLVPQTHAAAVAALIERFLAEE